MSAVSRDKDRADREIDVRARGVAHDMNTRGVLTISIDVELAWGDCDKTDHPRTRTTIGLEREIITRILALFSAYDIRATWAVVGHLFLTTCEWKGDEAHPEIGRPILKRGTRDWFFRHPRNGDNELWYGPDIVDRIRTASPPQEIGSHSFCHLPYDERLAHGGAVRADVQMAKRLHEASGLAFQAFVFPRNAIGHRDLLANAGIRVYRGRAPRWYDGVPCLPRILNLLSFVLRVPPQTVAPVRDDTELVSLPGSMLLMGRAGIRRMIPPGNLIHMARAGLHRAVERAEIFHLWFHPSNFAYQMPEQLRVLETILQTASDLRKQGVLEVLTMGDVEERVAQRPPAGDHRPIDAIRVRAIAHHNAVADEFVDKYQRGAENYFSSAFAYGRRKVEDVLNDTLRGLARGSKVLDIGCGTGEHVRICRQSGFNVVAIEPAEQMRATAQALNPGVPILSGVITSLPFEDQAFDLVLAIEVLRYLHREDVRQAYREMHRVLHPGGRLFFTMVNRFGSNGFYIYDGLRRLSALLFRGEAPIHCEFVTPREIRRDLAELGMEPIAFHGRACLPVHLAYKVRTRWGSLLAHRSEPLDDWLSRKPWAAPLAGHLIVIATRARTSAEKGLEDSQRTVV